jgi:hypothetical protein
VAFFPIQKIINEDVAINKMACLQPIDIHHCSRWWGYRKPIPSLVSQMIAPFFAQFVVELPILLNNNKIK